MTRIFGEVSMSSGRSGGRKILALMLLTLIACESPPNQQSESSTSADSLAAARLDSLQQNDPYVKYSFVERQGKSLFDHYCAVCHGPSGQGDGFNSYNLDPRPHSFADTTYMRAISDATLTEVVARGGRGVNKSVLMPAYSQTLNTAQIEQVIYYLRTFTTSKEIIETPK